MLYAWRLHGDQARRVCGFRLWRLPSGVQQSSQHHVNRRRRPASRRSHGRRSRRWRSNRARRRPGLLSSPSHRSSSGRRSPGSSSRGRPSSCRPARRRLPSSSRSYSCSRLQQMARLDGRRRSNRHSSSPGPSSSRSSSTPGGRASRPPGVRRRRRASWRCRGKLPAVRPPRSSSSCRPSPQLSSKSRSGRRPSSRGRSRSSGSSRSRRRSSLTVCSPLLPQHPTPASRLLRQLSLRQPSRRVQPVMPQSGPQTQHR